MKILQFLHECIGSNCIILVHLTIKLGWRPVELKVIAADLSAQRGFRVMIHSIDREDHFIFN